MDSSEQENVKIVITERFINALDYLIESGRVKNVTEFEKLTGFRAQRITGMRAFLKGDVKLKGHYAGTPHIKTLKQLFNVSMDYIFDGIGPIVNDLVLKMEDSSNLEHNSDIKRINQEIMFLKEKVNFINEKVDLYKEYVIQKLS